MIKLVIFDMDGVIYSSEHLNDEARSLLLKQYNIPYDIMDVAGKSHREIWDPLIAEFKLSDSQPEIERKQDQLVLEMVKQRNLPLCPGVQEVLDELRNRGIRIALASSSARWLVNNVLEHYDIKNMFYSIITGDDVRRSKPDPEIYLATLDKCMCLPQDALAIEDSDSGQAAAVAAGIKCIGYINPTSGNQQLSESIARIDDMKMIFKYI